MVYLGDRVKPLAKLADKMQLSSRNLDSSNMLDGASRCSPHTGKADTIQCEP